MSSTSQFKMLFASYPDRTKTKRKLGFSGIINVIDIPSTTYLVPEKEEEEVKDLKEVEEQSSSLSPSSSPPIKKLRKCPSCLRTGHKAKTCPEAICFDCGEVGHASSSSAKCSQHIPLTKKRRKRLTERTIFDHRGDIISVQNDDTDEDEEEEEEDLPDPSISTSLYCSNCNGMVGHSFSNCSKATCNYCQQIGHGDRFSVFCTTPVSS